jgi:hypothetical protein
VGCFALCLSRVSKNPKPVDFIFLNNEIGQCTVANKGSSVKCYPESCVVLVQRIANFCFKLPVRSVQSSRPLIISNIICGF